MTPPETRSGTLISVEEYLATSYRPDCDYVDGHIEERNLGEFDHSRLQTAISSYFFTRRKEWDITVVVEQRVQVKPTRFRIPDVCIVLGQPDAQIFRHPPFLCIEILSKDDRMSQMQERIDDYLAMGVRYVWVLDPASRRAYVATAATGLREVREAVLRTENPALDLPLDAVFA
jgi:Uma2 family endonuclease